MTDIYEDRATSEEYKQWKKNTPFMYDFMMSRIFEYPSQTIQWLNDDIEKIDDDPNESTLQRILYGTNTGHFDIDNFLIVASVTLPGYKEPSTNIDLYNMPEDAFGSFVHYNDQFEADFKLFHNGPVQCARAMPEKENIIATRNYDDLYIYDIKDCLKDYDVSISTSPILSFTNLQSQTELDWNRQTNGFLLTGYKRTKAAVWDLNSQKKRKTLTTKLILSCKNNDDNDEDEIYDINWHQKHPEICSAITHNGNILLWDIRSNRIDRPSHYFNGHKGSTYQIKFNPFSEYVFITSGSDCQIAIWDLRNLNEKLHSIKLKQEKFHTIKWSPHCETLFGGLTNDRKVYLFDIDKIFDELLQQEIEHGPSILTFVHGGHTSKVNDFDWNHNDNNPLMICSVSDDNVFQIWQMSSKFVTPDTNESEI